MRFLTTFLFLCLLVLLSLFSHSVVSADSYDPNLSKSLLHLAGAAYCHPSWLAKWSCSFCKEEPNFQVHKVVDNGVTIMQTIVGVLNNNTIVVSFKGTDPLSIENWLEDLSFVAKSVDICPAAGCKVHQGFFDTYMSVQDETVSAVKELKIQYPHMNIMITGHSLGGALTTIAALDFAQIPTLMPSHVYTFGQPRVGNPQFENFFNNLLYNASVYRVTHGMDPVPHLPPMSFDFKHFPTEIYYDELNDTYLNCDGSGEDPHCSNKWLLDLLVTDHLTYLGLDFMTEFLACKLEMGK